MNEQPKTEFAVKRDSSINFYNDSGQVGRLDFNGPKMTFTGDADESAKKFIEFVSHYFEARLEQERNETRAWCIKAIETEVADWDREAKEAALEAAEAIRSKDE